MRVHFNYKALKWVEAIGGEELMLCHFESPFAEAVNKYIQVNLLQINKWMSGTAIQDAMPHLSADERELFLSGIEDFDAVFGSDDDE